MARQVNLNKHLSLYVPEMKIAEFANSIDLDEVALMSHLIKINTVCPLVFEF